LSVVKNSKMGCCVGGTSRALINSQGRKQPRTVFLQGSHGRRQTTAQKNLESNKAVIANKLKQVTSGNNT
jgi:hypothetical protein